MRAIGDHMSDASCDIGLIGLAVMGQNLVLNMNDHGFKVAVFNRTVSKRAGAAPGRDFAYRSPGGAKPITQLRFNPWSGARAKKNLASRIGHQ